MQAARQHTTRPTSKTPRCPYLGCWPVTARTRVLHLRCAASRAEGPEPFDEFTTRALQEACELLSKAQQLAQNQTRGELLQSMQSTSSAGDPGSTDAAGMSETAMYSFWIEQGLSAQQAAQLTKELLGQPQDLQEQQQEQQDGQHGTNRMRWTSDSLAAKLAMLQRVLPDVSVARMVHREPALLEADPAALVQALLELLQEFPAGTDVMAMVSAQPRLLLAGDVGSRAKRTLDKLLQLHPSRDRLVVAGIVEENPELIFRIPDFYHHAMLLDDLPIEIQNMMVHADQGIGWLHRYYRLQRQEVASSKGNSTDGGTDAHAQLS